jgi:predicted metal-binding membrane protein
VSTVGVPVTVVPSPPRPRSRPGVGAGGEGRLVTSPRRLVALVCLSAWALLVSAELTGLDAHLHHDVVAERDGGHWTGPGLFLLGWMAMVAAMMLPTIAPALGPPPARRGVLARPVVAFLAGFAAPWAAAGGALLSFDMVLHRLVDGAPALAARPWLVTTALLGVAGLAQLAPSTWRHLAATARPLAVMDVPGSAFADGAAHGARCLRADGPLMLVMFAAGASVGWMAPLTVVMAIERSPRLGRQTVALAGIVLLCAAALAALHPGWLPAGLASGR